MNTLADHLDDIGRDSHESRGLKLDLSPTVSFAAVSRDSHESRGLKLTKRSGAPLLAVATHTSRVD